jgi:hypothetical protein
VNILKVNFQELYERHLCRHSQFGINIIHVVAVLGIYLALAGIICWLVGSPWWLLCIIAPHLAVVAFNVPFRVFLGNLLFMALFMVLFVEVFAPLPAWWVWIYVLAIPLFYKIQAWSHKIYNVERDMTEYNKKYKKGFVLFVLLSVYEMPILLNYLVFDRNNWPVWSSHSRVEAPTTQPGAAPEG